MTKGWGKKAAERREQRLLKERSARKSKKGKDWPKHAHKNDANKSAALAALPQVTAIPLAPLVPGLNFRRAVDVKPEKVRWLWEPWFARGKVSIIAGEPGLGKSQIAIGMAATVSTGGAWPLSTETSSTGDVVIVSVEDGVADTIQPRLDAAGANLDRVHLIESAEDEKGSNRPFSLLSDLGRLKDLLGKLKKPRLVVFDPLNACMMPNRGQAFSPNSVPHVRALMVRVAQLAAQYKVAIIFITHFTKGGGKSALAKITGSFAFTAAVRSVFAVTRDTVDPDRRIFTPAKNNLGPDAAGLAFRIKPKTTAGGIDSSVIEWESYVPASQPVVLSDLDEAVEFLKLAVAGKTEIRANELFKQGGGQGFSKKALRKAAARLGYRSVRKGGFAAGGYWSFERAGTDDEKEWG